MRASFFYLFFVVTTYLNAELTFESPVTPFLNQYCYECHGGKKVKGKVDFNDIKSTKDLKEHYEIFENALDLVHDAEMPPEDELQPTETEIKVFETWVIETFNKNVVARAGIAKPRKLSVNELNNTLNDFLGFPLEVSVAKAQETPVETSVVKKVLPVDPPGLNGYENDTHNNPLTNTYWENLSYIFDFAIEELFSKQNTKHLERYTGKLNPQKWTWEQSEKLIRNALPKIYRRHLDEDELKSILSNLNKKQPGINELKFELKTAFMSPRFLFRSFSMPVNEGQHPVDSYELAERTSYFLWESMPDDELLNTAKDKSILKPEILKHQIKRMLKDGRSKNLSEHFAYQWFSLSEIDHSDGRFPYIQSLIQQPIDFFNYLIQEDRPLIEIVDSKVTYANHLLKKFYQKDAAQINPYNRTQGIEMVFTNLNKINLEKTQNRGGLLTMPGILAMNAAKNRTSPVLRGTWILEKIIGDHLPDPPMDVNPVPPNKKGETLSFRERFEKHRSDTNCAVCHNKIDPLGFSLEAFDAKGIFRTKIQLDKNTKIDVDAKGDFKGEPFNNFQELKKILVNKHSDDIIENIVKQMMSYALCRKLELHDKPTVEKIVHEMKETNGTYQDLIYKITSSLPFKEVFRSSEEL